MFRPTSSFFFGDPVTRVTVTRVTVTRVTVTRVTVTRVTVTRYPHVSADELIFTHSMI